MQFANNKLPLGLMLEKSPEASPAVEVEMNNRFVTGS